jgi:hypothetical protein
MAAHVDMNTAGELHSRHGLPDMDQLLRDLTMLAKLPSLGY